MLRPGDCGSICKSRMSGSGRYASSDSPESESELESGVQVRLRVRWVLSGVGGAPGCKVEQAVRRLLVSRVEEVFGGLGEATGWFFFLLVFDVVIVEASGGLETGGGEGSLAPDRVLLMMD
ncbi:uncharacterized protein MELLADRAFT_70680 [Melampsora larici-populina 98AG31]|uniref:Uncharacterized protein n=1 Tax=Melampsora larici-populina (strain 98AG31 / pathotype 3-4-7) TaxID=747676 RepID=F4R5D2_MELLP|nr:uncharacterized protein MELLADRAFT_70680 [Melampsora larici-populina 98AG31]EGG12280.1 hypothetical protein MELLADRAFT_70680 [Melampsora larici-populina 98AG31]